MRMENVLPRVGWLCTVALVLATGRMAMADDNGKPLDSVRAAFEQAIAAQRRVFDQQQDATPLLAQAELPTPSSYWLGIGCGPVGDELRAQLNLPENQGIMVHSVSPESPAAAAGIEKYDVLLGVGDKPLESVADLSHAVADAKDENALEINLVRHGEKMTVAVTPAKRPEHPEGEAGPDFETIITPENDTVRQWLDKLRPGEFARIPHRLRIFRPHAVIEKTFPDDLSVQITKQGKNPAKVVVEQGDQKWEVSEDTLTELPESVRGHVQALLGRFPGADFSSIVTDEVQKQLEGLETPAIPELPRIPYVERGPLQEQLQRQIDQLNEQLNKVRDTLKDLRLDRPRAEEGEKEGQEEDAPQDTPRDNAA